MSVIHVDQENFESEVLKSEKPVVVDFFADWCGPCKILGPMFEELSGEIDYVKFAKLNVEEANELAGRFMVSNIPTTIFIKDGKEVKRMVGLVPKTTLQMTIEEVFK